MQHNGNNQRLLSRHLKEYQFQPQQQQSDSAPPASQLLYLNQSKYKDKYKRSISVRQQYEYQQSLLGRRQRLQDQFDQILYEEMLKKRARQFIIKIKKQKQAYQGKLIMQRQNQEDRKNMRKQHVEQQQHHYKSIRLERKRLIDLKKMQQIKLRKERQGYSRLMARQQQLLKSQQRIQQLKNLQKQNNHKYKRLQTILQDKDSSRKGESKSKLNVSRRQNSQPSDSKMRHHQSNHLPRAKTFKPNFLQSSSQSLSSEEVGKVRRPAKQKLFSAEDMKKIEDIKDKMSILIKLNRKA